MRHHRRTRLGWKAGAGAGALLLAATACGGGDGGSSGGTVTLRMYSTTTTEPAFSVLIDGFHKSQSKIKIKAEYIPSAKVGQVTTTMMQAGNPPDLIMASPGSGGGSNGLSVHRLAEANRLADLSARPWANDLPELLKPTAQYDGKSYSLILGVSTQFLNYTTTDFDKWKVKPPKSFKELLDMCAMIKTKGMYAMASGAADMAGNRMRMQVFSAANVYALEPDWDKKRAAGQVKFQTSPGWKKTFQQVQDLVTHDCYYPGSAGRTTEEARKLGASGKTTMGIGPSIAAAYLSKANPDRKWAAAAVPAGDTSTPNLPLEVAGISVAKRAKHVGESIEFLDYLAAHRDVYSKNSGAFSPAMMAKGELPDFLKPLEPLAKQNRFSLAASTMWPSEAPAQVAYKYMTGLHNNTRTVDDILKAMDQAWDNGK
ncbi:ABC transporter substrate-binding protein [Actinomadura sp. 9N215]|uniref:ABC transporter substrate-binding protein n=1 Tax=Actinomadura sp. 9N215 TaxID=3375150 RepID=UPI00379ED6BB